MQGEIFLLVVQGVIKTLLSQNMEGFKRNTALFWVLGFGFYLGDLPRILKKPLKDILLFAALGTKSN